jgi:hypothetical protein
VRRCPAQPVRPPVATRTTAPSGHGSESGVDASEP